MPSCDLENIIDTITVPPIVNREEYQCLCEAALYLVDVYVTSDPLRYMSPDFEETAKNEVQELLVLSMGHEDSGEEELQETIGDAVNQAMADFFRFQAPRRSYKRHRTVQVRHTAGIQDQIKNLESIPQAEQRTHEWYQFRHSVLNASSAWKVFYSESTRNQLIYDKCQPWKEFSASVSLESPLHWGQKYEPLSVMWYEDRYNTKVSDFGAIPHPSHTFLAASPDGINTLQSSPLYGRMLEIKNIVNRDITGIPKYEYWVQMQLQMEVCGLSACDFLETRFKEYPDIAAYVADGSSWSYTADGKAKGIMHLFSTSGQPRYEYAPFGCTQEEYVKWEAELMEKCKEETWISVIYWRLEEVSCVVVRRNQLWFSAALPILKSVWNTILEERETGYEHRAPRKKCKPSPPVGSLAGDQIACMIDISKLSTLEPTQAQAMQAQAMQAQAMQAQAMQAQAMQDQATVVAESDVMLTSPTPPILPENMVIDVPGDHLAAAHADGADS